MLFSSYWPTLFQNGYDLARYDLANGFDVKISSLSHEFARKLQINPYLNLQKGTI